MPNLHPIAVHFPIALLTASLVLDLTGVIFQNTHAMKSGWWIFLSGSVGLAATVITGLLARSTVIVPEHAHSVLDTHQELAFISVVIVAGLLLWRVGAKTAIPQRHRTLFMSLYTAALILMWLGALQGGELVYHHGVGVKALLP